MNFREAICAHLSKYRQDVLRIEPGYFLHRGRRIPKGHILPRERFRDNLLEPYRDQFFASEFGVIKLHKYFHHLNSSQALCINLLFPLLARQRHDVLTRSLGLSIKPPILSRFESESVLEVAKRRTSFDFHLRTEERDILALIRQFSEA